MTSKLKINTNQTGNLGEACPLNTLVNCTNIMKLQRFGFWEAIIYVTLMSIAVGLIISAYVNWFKNPDMTYMEMTIKYIWYWIGAIACAVACIYLVTRNEYS